jgi:hypothetical protein
MPFRLARAASPPGPVSINHRRRSARAARVPSAGQTGFGSGGRAWRGRRPRNRRPADRRRSARQRRRARSIRRSAGSLRERGPPRARSGLARIFLARCLDACGCGSLLIAVIYIDYDVVFHPPTIASVSTAQAAASRRTAWPRASLLFAQGTGMCSPCCRRRAGSAWWTSRCLRGRCF